MRLPVLLTIGSLGLAGVAGSLTALALGGSSQEPISTTTITIPAATPFDCGAGFHVGLVVLNHPGGQITTKTCVKN